VIEGAGLGAADLARLNPRLVTVRIRPGQDARGPLPDLELLHAARAGLLTQIRGNRPGPVFCDFAVAQAGAGVAAAVGALALLYQRENTGVGGWAETSLADGLRAVLPLITGRVERPSPSTTLLWTNQGPAESLAYCCADGEYLQLWFGARGGYEAFLARMDEPPSEQGYQADLISGAMAERDGRWARRFATRDRATWLSELAGQPFRVEPVLRPGEALLDDHVRRTGLARTAERPGGGTLTVLGPVIRVTPAGPPAAPPDPSPVTAPVTAPGPLLSGVRVLDLSAYLAGPVAPQILADLGADVVKVEPVNGDAHRGMEPMFAAGQRGKRAVAVDLKGPGAAGVLARLFAWADVVHHNSRVGLDRKLGYDEATVRAANPGVVHSFASGFGPDGPRARLAANDQLMQALSGIEAGQGGPDRPPNYLVWSAVDVFSGWVGAASILAALCARRRGGAGQSVAGSLLGSALLLKSGAVLHDGEPAGVPVVDEQQTGYGAAYRIYQGSDDAWFALAVPDAATWQRLREVVRPAFGGTDPTADPTPDPTADLPADPPPLRLNSQPATAGNDAAEKVLEAAFRTGTAAAWAARLHAAGVPAEPVLDADRTAFVARALDDPVRRQLGRVVTFAWGARGRLEQTALPLAFGPGPAPHAPRHIPGLGEHTGEVLTALGLSAGDQETLAAAGTIPGPGPGR
jgi:crotonobetainyl-CoA:carnitine CoA-transferase CaiB-like acyl-CoA transferase